MKISNCFEHLPADCSPQQIALKIAHRFERETVDSQKHYKEACVWYGALRAASLLQDRVLLESLYAKYAPFAGSYEELLSGEGHVDNNVFGIVPLEIALQTGDPGCREEGLAVALHQYRNIGSQIRYAIDDMFMITALQIQAWRVSGDNTYRDLAADTMADYLGKLQQADGLFFHHPDFPHRWSRGNGWVAAGMAQLIPQLSEDHPRYRVIYRGFHSMMEALSRTQIAEGKDAGLWRQIVDSDDSRNWAETSGSAMFCYALVTGLFKGWLDPGSFGETAERAWIALSGRLNPDGALEDVSKWAYKPESHPESGDRYIHDEENYYFERERLTGDNHGQAPLLWTACALIEGGI